MEINLQGLVVVHHCHRNSMVRCPSVFAVWVSLHMLFYSYNMFVVCLYLGVSLARQSAYACLELLGLLLVVGQ